MQGLAMTIHRGYEIKMTARTSMTTSSGNLKGPMLGSRDHVAVQEQQTAIYFTLLLSVDELVPEWK